ncbi:MAG TPA: hypothetical protein IAA84_02065 [Candidatus Alectryocaccomicrobium excrementavium]|uniref:Poly(Hydroxyalkanoate) granule-associated protein n=1 Tax=Candidatus Alectryocaccomicrobium excrementavium TaxID=2840668 RepID=A0A9D1K5N1_9FIRM|nr:hypothetical protein [Candidatus Alectryocaccomicrobium excrementavium]HIV31093.1 hypothetical protein [Candidatus Pullichristensenella excrementipullorum]
MANWEEGLRKAILAGVGAAAATAEKGHELLHELVQKGESTVEEGKVRNEELKRDLKERVKEHVTIAVSPQDGDALLRCVDSMTRKQRDELRKRLDELDKETPADAPDSPDGGE